MFNSISQIYSFLSSAQSLFSFFTLKLSNICSCIIIIHQIQLSMKNLLIYNFFFCQWSLWVLCRLVCVVSDTIICKNIYVCIIYEAQLMHLLKQNFSSVFKSLLQQFLRTSSSDYVILWHTWRTEFNKKICWDRNSMNKHNAWTHICQLCCYILTRDFSGIGARG